MTHHVLRESCQNIILHKINLSFKYKDKIFFLVNLEDKINKFIDEFYKNQKVI